MASKSGDSTPALDPGGQNQDGEKQRDEALDIQHDETKRLKMVNFSASSSKGDWTLPEQSTTRTEEPVIFCQDTDYTMEWSKCDKSECINLISGSDIQYRSTETHDKEYKEKCDEEEYEYSLIRTTVPISSEEGEFYFEMRVLDGGVDNQIGVGIMEKSHNTPNGTYPEKKWHGDYIEYTGHDGAIYFRGKLGFYPDDDDDDDDDDLSYLGSYLMEHTIPFSAGDKIGLSMKRKNEHFRTVQFTRNGGMTGSTYNLSSQTMLYPFIYLGMPGARVQTHFGRRLITSTDIPSSKTGSTILDLPWEVFEKSIFKYLKIEDIKILKETGNKRLETICKDFFARYAVQLKEPSNKAWNTQCSERYQVYIKEPTEFNGRVTFTSRDGRFSIWWDNETKWWWITNMRTRGINYYYGDIYSVIDEEDPIMIGKRWRYRSPNYNAYETELVPWTGSTPTPT